jgi:hypothetical protein
MSISSNATPADKEHGSDLGGIAYMRSEGKISEADAIEDLSSDFTSPVDNNAGDSQFGIFIDGSELADEIEKVLEIEISEQTALASSISFSPAQSSYLTSGGNIAIDIAGTGLNLASESPVFLVKMKYLKRL